MKGFIVFLIIATVCVVGILKWPEIEKALRAKVGSPDSSGQLSNRPVLDAPTSRDDADGPGENPDDKAPDVPESDPFPRQPKVVDEGMPDEPAEPEATMDEFAEAYPMPEFPPIEEVVGNWNEIPTSAFPREIILEAPVKWGLAGGVGSSTVPAGTHAYALAINGDVLTVSPDRNSPIKGTAKMEDTNFTTALTEVYENYKQRRVRAVLAKRDQARREKMAGVYAARAADAAKSQLLGEKPTPASNGAVPAMVESIENEDVTEFNVSMIDAWGPILYDEVEGEPYWIGTVQYKARTIFGTFPAEAMALMRQGRVIKWVYSGSHEPVP